MDESPERRALAGKGHDSGVADGRSSVDGAAIAPDSEPVFGNGHLAADSPAIEVSGPEHAAVDAAPSEIFEDPTELPVRSPQAVLDELRPWDLDRVERAITPDGVERDLLAHNAPPELARSALSNPYANMSPSDIVERYWDRERNTWDWPSHYGFRDGNYDTARTFPEDLVLDRVGLVTDWTGDFLSSAGDSYPSRALAPGTSGEYHVFRGTEVPLPPEWELRFGEAGSAFDQPGGSTQWVVIDEEGNHILINQLVNEGYLRRVSREP